MNSPNHRSSSSLQLFLAVLAGGILLLAIAETGGVEFIGIVGVRRHRSTSVDVFGSISYDNINAKLFRTGFTWKF